MPQFHETGYGKRFFDRQLPELTKAINRLAKSLEEANRRNQEIDDRKEQAEKDRIEDGREGI